MSGDLTVTGNDIKSSTGTALTLSGTDVQVACTSYTWPLNGTVYTANTNTSTVTLTNATGCDSVVTLDLTINTFAIGTSRVLMWEEDTSLYLGVINTVDGMAEIHYIKIQIGKD